MRFDPEDHAERRDKLRRKKLGLDSEDSELEDHPETEPRVTDEDEILDKPQPDVTKDNNLEPATESQVAGSVSFDPSEWDAEPAITRREEDLGENERDLDSEEPLDEFELPYNKEIMDEVAVALDAVSGFNDSYGRMEIFENFLEIHDQDGRLYGDKVVERLKDEYGHNSTEIERHLGRQKDAGLIDSDNTLTGKGAALDSIGIESIRDYVSRVESKIDEVHESEDKILEGFVPGKKVLGSIGEDYSVLDDEEIAAKLFQPLRKNPNSEQSKNPTALFMNATEGIDYDTLADHLEYKNADSVSSSLSSLRSKGYIEGDRGDIEPTTPLGEQLKETLDSLYREFKEM